MSEQYIKQSGERPTYKGVGQPFKWFGPTIDEVGQLQQPSRMVWQAKYQKWKTNSAPAVAPTSTDGSPPRSAALSHKYKSDFTEILKNSIAEIQHIKNKIANKLHKMLLQGHC